MKEHFSTVRNFIFRHKYVLTIVAFVVYVLIFDRQNYFFHSRINKEMQSLARDTAYYIKEIKEAGLQLEELRGDRKALEKFAREKYLMKKDDEEVFVFIEKVAEDTTAAKR
jgi:cell division protein FtsB